MPTRTHTHRTAAHAALHREPGKEARLNPPMADDEEIFDPFAHLSDGTDDELQRMKLAFNFVRKLEAPADRQERSREFVLH